MRKYFQDHPSFLCFCAGGAPILWEGVLWLVCSLPGCQRGLSLWGIMTGSVNLLVLSLLFLGVRWIKEGRLQKFFPVLAAGWLIPYTIVALLVSLAVDCGLGEQATSGHGKAAWTQYLSWYAQGQLWTAFPLGIIGLMYAAWRMQKANKA